MLGPTTLKGNVMRFGVGQIVQCYRAFHPEHQKLLGSVGEIKKVLDPIESLLLIADYIVFFPAFPSGYCDRCNEIHDPLMFAMADFELKRVDDPDAETDRIVKKELTEDA